MTDWAVEGPDLPGFLAHLEASAAAQLVGQEQEHRCLECGRSVWIAALDQPPDCCGWDMIGLPQFREVR